MKTLDLELKETSAQVGYMLKWLAFQQEHGGFQDQDVEVAEWFLSNINQAKRWRESLYKKNRALGFLKGQVAAGGATRKDVEQSVGQMCVWMLQIGAVWINFQANVLKFDFAPMPVGRSKKDREMAEVLEVEYDPEKYA